MGSAVNGQDLRWNIGEYASHGIGALEITPIYGVKGNSSNNIDFLSPKYMEMLKVTADACNQNGIELGMATGTGWPFGGPWVPLEESASQMVIVDTIVNAKKVKDLGLRPEAKKRSNSTLVDVYAFGNGTFLRLGKSLSADGVLNAKLDRKSVV